MSRTNAIISRFPQFFRSEEERNTFYAYIRVFGQLLDMAEEDLIRVMNAHWVLKADNEGSKGFDTVTKGDLDKIFALYLENLGGTSLLRQTNRREKPEEAKADDNEYRRRILGLIEVLRDGASTKDGIRRIVAANLGILGDDPWVEVARNTIEIEEYLPAYADFIPEEKRSLHPNESFEISNKQPEPVSPEARMNVLQEGKGKTFYATLLNPGIVDANDADKVLFRFNGEMNMGDLLIVDPNGEGRLNGNIVIKPDDNTPELPSGPSTWSLDTWVIFPEAHFKDDAHPRKNDDCACRFDFSVFGDIEQTGNRETETYDQQRLLDNNYNLDAVKLQLAYFHQTPAAFAVVIPWDIPWYTADVIITDETLERLQWHDMPQDWLDALTTVKNQPFERLADFLKAAALPAEWGQPAPKENGKSPLTWLDLILRYAAYTDRYANMAINPRNQIRYIVDKVRAAGVYAEVRYKKTFREIHDPMENIFVGQITGKLTEEQGLSENPLGLSLQLDPFLEPHDIAENNRLNLAHSISEIQAPKEGRFTLKSTVMTQADYINVQNNLTIRKLDSHGKIVEERHATNTIMYSGRLLIAKLFVAFDNPKPVGWFAVGEDGSDQKVPGKLNSPVFTKKIEQVTGDNFKPVRDIPSASGTIKPVAGTAPGSLLAPQGHLGSTESASGASDVTPSMRVKLTLSGNLTLKDFPVSIKKHALQEAGLVNSKQEPYILYNRVTFGSITLSEGFTLAFDWEIIF